MSLELTDPAGRAGSPTETARLLAVVATRGDDVPGLARVLSSLATCGEEPVDVVVVVPPGARDARDVARRSGARLVDDPGRGRSAAVNAGLAVATAGHVYATWLSTDDEMLTGAPALAAARLDADPRAVVAHGDVRHLDAVDGGYLVTRHCGALARRVPVAADDAPGPPAGLVRLDALQGVGGLDESLEAAADLDLVLRLAARGAVVHTGRTMSVFHRRVGSSAVGAELLRELGAVRSRHLPAAAALLGSLRDRATASLSRGASAAAQRAAGWGGA